MKRILLFLTCVLTLFGVARAGQATWNAATNANTSQSSLAAAKWTLVTGTTYTGWDATKGLQIGSGNNPSSAFTVTSSNESEFYGKQITKIVVNASTASSATATIEVSVNGKSYGSKSLTTTATNYEFEGNEVAGDVVIKVSQTTSKALYLKSIAVTYSDQGEVEPEPQGNSVTFQFTGLADAYNYVTAFNLTDEDHPVTFDASTSTFSYPKGGTGLIFDASGYELSISCTEASVPGQNYMISRDMGYMLQIWDGANGYTFTVNVTDPNAQPDPDEPGDEGLIDDEITIEFTGVTATSYANGNFSGKEGKSGAVYAGQIIKSDNNNGGVIQMRGTSPSGIITTTSGGKVQKIKVSWHNTGNTNGRVLDIYGKKSAYSTAGDLYNNSNQGTKLGSITYGSSTELQVSGDYTFIGIRPSSGAAIFDGITITWEKQAAGEIIIEAPVIVCENNIVSLSCTTDNSVIYYTTNGNTPDKSSTKYDGNPFSIDQTTTVKAIAYVEDKESAVTEYKAYYLPAQPMSVVEALALINDGYEGELTAKGIVNRTTNYNTTYGSITYYISDDGSKTNELQVYGGLNIGGTKFNAQSDIEAGATVTVKGNVKIYNGNPEFDSNNVLIEYIAPAKEYTALDRYEDEEISFELGESFTLELGDSHPEITYEYEPTGVITIDENGVITAEKAGDVIVTASWSASAAWTEGDAMFTVEVTEPTGELGEIIATVSDGQELVNEGTITITEGTTITFTAKNANSIVLYSEIDDVEEDGSTLVWTPSICENEIVMVAAYGNSEGESKDFEFTLTVKKDVAPEQAQVTYDFTTKTYGQTVQESGTTYISSDAVMSSGEIDLTVIGNTRLWKKTNGVVYRLQKSGGFTLSIENGNILTVELDIDGTNNITPEGYSSTSKTWNGKASSVSFNNSKDYTTDIKTITVTYELVFPEIKVGVGSDETEQSGNVNHGKKTINLQTQNYCAMVFIYAPEGKVPYYQIVKPNEEAGYPMPSNRYRRASEVTTEPSEDNWTLAPTYSNPKSEQDGEYYVLLNKGESGDLHIRYADDEDGNNPSDYVTYAYTVKDEIPTGVETVVVGVGEGEVIYFDLNGRRVANPDKGIFIKVEADKVSKVIL